MAVSIDTSHGLVIGKPERVLSEYSYYGVFDVDRTGTRFLVVSSKRTPASSQIQFIFNWFTELKRRVPVK